MTGNPNDLTGAKASNPAAEPAKANVLPLRRAERSNDAHEAARRQPGCAPDDDDNPTGPTAA